MAFRPAKRKVGIYFNDGDSQTSVQADTGPADPRFIAAVKAAKEVFFREYRKALEREEAPDAR